MADNEKNGQGAQAQDEAAQGGVTLDAGRQKEPVQWNDDTCVGGSDELRLPSGGVFR